MERFTYARTGAVLKNHVMTLGLIASVDLVSWLVAAFLVPQPWGLLLGGAALTLVF